MEQIQALSNERQRLYRAKWTKRNQPTFRERIKQLDRQIATLWHLHRCELAAESRCSALPRPASLDIYADYRSRIGEGDVASSYQVRDGDGWRNVSAERLTGAIKRYVADLPERDPDDIEIVPLKDLLARRGLTLEWRAIEGGSGYGRLVGLPT
jgi:hypothetical protein